MLSFGFVIKFIVFSLSVCSVVLVFFLVSVDIIIIGVGIVFIIIFKKCNLFIFGILMFRVIMFGLNFCIICFVV